MEGSAAVWLFGFDTVRVDPEGVRETRRLDEPGVGSVVGAEGAMYMYDASSGRVGMLDATTNTLRERAALAGWPAGERDGLIAVSRTRLWLVTGPGELSRLDRASLDVMGTTDADAAATGTWIAAADSSVFAAIETGGALDIARLDENGAIVARTPVTDLEPLGPLQAIEASRELVWIVGERGARALAARDLTARGDANLSPEAGPIRASVAVGGDLWVIAQNGGVAYRIALDGDARQLALLPAPPSTFRGQVDLAASDDAVFALVPTGTAPDDRSAAVHRINPDTMALIESLRTPSALFVGAIALTE
ncbi:MAG: hypothetical protein ACT4OX_17155 [Actinomycetota bacterium]